MSREMALWLKTLKHLIVQVLTLALYRGKKKKQKGLLMRLSIAYLFWATIIGFLIQIFLTLGKTGVGSECTPPLLALWLSFLLITWDPLGRLWGAADVGETCRGEITCWECLAVAVQRSPPPAPAQFLTEPIALWNAVAWLLLLAAQSASLLHPNAFFQKKMLYVCILVSFDWNCWNILQSATSARHLWRGFSLLSSQCVLDTSKGENFSLVCNWANNSSRGKGKKKKILAGFLHPKLVKSFCFFSYIHGYSNAFD